MVRMRKERLTKALVFGWYEGLEGNDKKKVDESGEFYVIQKDSEINWVD